MASTRFKEHKYSPAEICKWFDLHRTTLFRWETEGWISEPERDDKGQRVYRQRHLSEIANVIRRRCAEEEEQAFEHNPDGEFPRPRLQERLYRAEFFGEVDRRHGLQMLKSLAGQLSENTIHALIENALQQPKGDPIRYGTWELLMAHERTKS